jgi:alkanesulfonate monooxygenase SsuD/methylene tetrahydromethanopterin reductase-like flavin-dependent oxidoreductase (luciferase family)
MFIGWFTERPYQDPETGFYGNTARPITDLNLSNGEYNPRVAGPLYHRYLDELVYAEEVGFDALMLNEHHSTPFCMGSVMDVEAAILARITKKAKIWLMGNILPIWDDPLWLAEELAMIDMISLGRLVPGFVRGSGRESVVHNAAPPYNWERFQEAYDFIIKCWTTPGPFRWEGEHFQYRYVNPFTRPYQQPHPPVWIPGIISKNTMEWAAQRGLPYMMLATEPKQTGDSFDYYHQVARANGINSGTQNIGYLWKVHVDETEELADDCARKYLQGPSNPFLEGNQGTVRNFLQNLPGIHSRAKNFLPTIENAANAYARGQITGQAPASAGSVPAPSTPGGAKDAQGSLESQRERLSIISGTPATVIPKIRQVLEYIRPGSIVFWDGDGSMDHDDSMRSLRLFGSDVLPAIREMAKDLELYDPYERDTITGKPIEQVATV